MPSWTSRRVTCLLVLEVCRIKVRIGDRNSYDDTRRRGDAKNYYKVFASGLTTP